MTASRLLFALSLILVTSTGLASTNRNAPHSTQIATAKASTESVTVTGVQTCERTDITIAGSVTGTTDQGDGMDFITLELWDDGTLMDSAQVDVPVGDTISFNEILGFFGPYLTSASGVGVYIVDSDGSTSLFTSDPFVPVDECAGAAHFSPTNVPAGSPTSLTLLALLAAMGGMMFLRRRG
ncbi:hypothetical protein OS187_07420 [Xanthomonadaceae bacterium JHOS43]|nr:hypothetical protein [Xanthomonadaceae bacterium JHOS43]MCX7562864.1 hypothetical protein [Xanthomonadaceae bacterium XH05]